MSSITGLQWVKCGHAGTLDPLATGLLIIATRGKTKVLSQLIGLDKTYLLRMRFGVTSPSFDLERPIEITGGDEMLTNDMVRTAILALQGEHEQVPPIYSAIKQMGKAVYHSARAGKTPVMVARQIVVHDVEIISIDLPYACFRVRVSKGTYIRSLVHDVAASLGTGGLLIELEREAIGPWFAKDAISLDETLAILKEQQHKTSEPNHHS